MDNPEQRVRDAYEHEPESPAAGRGWEWWAIRGLIGAGIAMGAIAYALDDADAQQRPPCAPLGQMEAHLAEKYREARIGHGMIDRASALLFYATADGKTFTILSVNVQGIACMVASGTDLDLETIKPGEPA